MRYTDPGTRNPADSVAFYHQHRHLLGPIVDARVHTVGPGELYSMTLRDRAGREIALSGCRAGGRNEAARAAMHVLRDAGFPARQIRAVRRGPVWLIRAFPGDAPRQANLAWAGQHAAVSRLGRDPRHRADSPERRGRQWQRARLRARRQAAGMPLLEPDTGPWSGPTQVPTPEVSPVGGG